MSGSPSGTYFEVLASFVPNSVVEKLYKSCSYELQGKGENNPHDPQRPASVTTAETFDGAVLELQIGPPKAPLAKTTATAQPGQQHQQNPASGVNAFEADLDLDVEAFNSYLEKVIEKIQLYNGEIVNLSGTSMLVFWNSAAADEQLSTLVWRATKCAMVVTRMNDASSSLSLSARIGCGTVYTFWVGRSRFLYMYSGRPFQQIAKIVATTAQTDTLDQVFVSQEAWEQISKFCKAEPVVKAGANNTTTTALGSCQRVLKIKREISRPVICRSVTGGSQIIHSQKGLSPTDNLLSQQITKQMEFALRSFLSWSTIAKTDSFLQDKVCSRLGLQIPNNAGELRRVSIVAIELPTLAHEAYTYCLSGKYFQDLKESGQLPSRTHRSQVDPLDAVKRAHSVASFVQSVLEHYEGNLQSMSVEDKGTVIILTFGLYPWHHEDDPLRAVMTAMEIKKISELTRIGISTGRALTAFVGSKARREFIVKGDVVDRALSLMQTADSSAILCDKETYHISMRFRDHSIGGYGGDDLQNNINIGTTDANDGKKKGAKKGTPGSVQQDAFHLAFEQVVCGDTTNKNSTCVSLPIYPMPFLSSSPFSSLSPSPSSLASPSSVVRNQLQPGTSVKPSSSLKLVSDKNANLAEARTKATATETSTINSGCTPATTSTSTTKQQNSFMESFSEDIIVARKEERKFLEEKLRVLKEEGDGAVIIIQGDAGMGKSNLIKDLMRKARELNVVTLCESGTSAHHPLFWRNAAIPFGSWKGVFRSLFDQMATSVDGSYYHHDPDEMWGSDLDEDGGSMEFGGGGDMGEDMGAEDLAMMGGGGSSWDDKEGFGSEDDESDESVCVIDKVIAPPEYNQQHQQLPPDHNTKKDKRDSKKKGKKSKDKDGKQQASSSELEKERQQQELLEQEQQRQERVAEFVLSQLEQENNAHLAPLLNGVLDLRFPENHLTAQMSYQARIDKTRELLLYFLQDPTETPRLFIMENAHCFDQTSWSLIHSVIKNICPTLFVITTRQLFNNAQKAELEKIKQLGCLRSFSSDDSSSGTSTSSSCCTCGGTGCSSTSGNSCCSQCSSTSSCSDSCSDTPRSPGRHHSSSAILNSNGQDKKGMEIHIITLSPLPTEHVLKLVCKYLGIPEMPKRLVPLFEKTKGHPLLSLEMAISLKNSGAFQILQDQEQLQPKLPAAYSLEATFGGTLTNASSPSPNNNVVDPVNSLMSDAALEDILKTFSFSSALHSVISSRIDELKPSQQLTLKVASILGDSFDFNVLHSIYPKNYTKEQLKEDLNVLTKLQFVHSEKKRTRFSSNRTGRARIITYSRNRRHHNYSSTGSGHHRRKHHKKHHKHKKKSKSKSKSKKHSSDSDSFIVETAVEEEEDVAPTQSSKKALPSNLRKSKTIKIAKSANKQRDSSGNATSSENETKQSSKAGKSKSKGKGKEVMTGSEDEATTEEVKKPFSFLSASLKETGQWTASNKSTTAAPAVSERAAPSVVSFDEFEASSGSEKQSSTKRGRSKTSFDKRSSLINSEIEKGAAGLTQEPYGDYYDSGSGSVPVGYHYSSGSGYSSAACSGYGSGGGSSGGSEDGCTVKEVYYFNHLIIWETVYATLLPSQRRQWHKKAAEHYENVLLDLELQTSKRAMALQQQQMSETESGAESGSSYYPTASTSSSHSSSTASTLPSSSPVSSSAGSSPYTASPFSTAAAIISKSLSHAASCYYPMLAYHWNSAGNDLRALLYFQKSGKQALSIFAYQEAVEFYERAIALADRLNALSSASSASTIDSSSSSTSSSTSSSRRSLFFSKSSKSKNQQQQCNSNKNAAHQEISSFRLASWERKLTKAYLSLKKLTKAEQHARKALDLLGQPLSEGNGWFGSTGVEVFRQFAKRKLLGFMSFSSSSSSSSSNKDTPSLKAFKPAVLSGGGGSSGGGANAASDRGDHGMLSMLLKEDPTNATQLELSKCYYLCYKLKFLAEDFTSAFACISRSVKAAESVGRPTKQLARAYAAMCYFSASMYSMRGISRQFARSSIEITNSLVTTLQQNPATDSSTSSSASGSSASSISSVDGSQQEFGGNSRKNAECVMTVLLDTSHIHFTNGNWKVVNARLLKALQVSERYGDRAMKQYILAYYAMYWNMRGKFRRSLKLLEHPCFKEGGGSSLSSSSAETAFFADEQQQHNTSAGLAQSSAAVSTTNNDDGHHHHNNKKCKKCKKKNKRASSDVSSSSGSSSAVPTTVATTASDSTTTTTNSSNSDTLSSSSSSMKTKKKRSNHHHHHHRHRHSNNKQMVPSSSQEMKGGIRGIVGEDNSISPFSTKIVKAVSLLYLGELNQALDVLREKDLLSSCSKLWKDREHVLRHFVTALIHWCNKEYRASKRLLFYLIEKLRQLTAQANHFVMWSDFETTCFVLELCLSLWDYERYREQMTANKAAAAAAAAAADASSTASSPAPAPTPSPSASILSPSSLLVASSSYSSASSNSSSSASSSNSANFAHQPLPSPSASAPKAGTRELLLAGSANVFLLSKKMIKWEERALKLSRILEKLVKTYPIGQSRYLRLLGLLKWLSGNPKSSTKLWSKSLEEAQIHSMEHERGATHLFMGMYINIGSGSSSSSSSSSSNHPSPSFSASASLIGSNHPSHNQPSHHHNQQQQHYNEAAMKRKRGHFKEALSAFELCGAEYFYLLCCNEDMKHDMETEVEREGGYSASFHSSSAQQRRQQQQREEEEANDDDRSDSERSSASDSLFTSSLSASTSSLSTTAAVKPKKKSRVRVLTMENSREAKHKRQQQSFLASAAAAAPSSSAAAASSLSSSPSSPPSLTSSSKTSSSSCSSSSARRNIASSGGGGTTTEVDEDDFSSTTTFGGRVMMTSRDRRPSCCGFSGVMEEQELELEAEAEVEAEMEVEQRMKRGRDGVRGVKAATSSAVAALASTNGGR